MKISIITVVLDSKHFLRDAIESVISQSYPDIEYIIVDGGSKDGSLGIINSYGNKISKVISEPDKGIYDAMNKGISLATGDVIGFLNSDDFYSNSEVISSVVSKFTSEVDAVYADLDYISSSNKDKVIRKWRSGTFNNRLFYNGWMPPHPTFFARREVYQKFGGYNTTLHYSSDYELMLRFIVKHGIRLSYLPEVIIKMRVGGHSNRTFLSRLKAHLEDRTVWKLNGLKPHLLTLWLKPVQKILQYRLW